MEFFKTAAIDALRMEADSLQQMLVVQMALLGEPLERPSTKPHIDTPFWLKRLGFNFLDLRWAGSEAHVHDRSVELLGDLLLHGVDEGFVCLIM